MRAVVCVVATHRKVRGPFDYPYGTPEDTPFITLERSRLYDIFRVLGDLCVNVYIYLIRETGVIIYIHTPKHYPSPPFPFTPIPKLGSSHTRVVFPAQNSRGTLSSGTPECKSARPHNMY